MMSPKRTKYRKTHKGRLKGVAKGGTDLNLGSMGLKALEPERVTARQIEAARRAISRHMKRQGQLPGREIRTARKDLEAGDLQVPPPRTTRLLDDERRQLD